MVAIMNFLHAQFACDFSLALRIMGKLHHWAVILSLKGHR